MVQLNTDTAKERKIRQPRKWKAPAKPLVPAGPTTVVNVPPGSPGSTIQVPHPRAKGAFISVIVPASAKPGQAMLVPVPPVTAASAGASKSAAGPLPDSKQGARKSAATKRSTSVPAADTKPAVSAVTSTCSVGRSGWSTGGRT